MNQLIEKKGIKDPAELSLALQIENLCDREGRLPAPQVAPGGGGDVEPVTGKATVSVRDFAEAYLKKGWTPIPLGYATKFAAESGYRKNPVTLESVNERFKGQCNIGLALGPCSDHLVDIDLDCPEAIALAKYFLPPTNMKHGRKSAKLSHWWYKCPGLIKHRDFSHGLGKEKHDKTKIIELRTHADGGAHTMVPPSLHDKTLELLEWEDQSLTPALIAEPQMLISAVDALAVASMLMMFWKDGSRQDIAMSFAGLMAQNAKPIALTKQIVQAICIETHDEELQKRLSKVGETYRFFEQGVDVAGYSKLKEVLGPAVDKIVEWLGLKSEITKVSSKNSTWLPMTYGEILANTDRAPEYLFSNRFPKGIVAALAGAGGVGKSWLVMSLAASLAGGRTIFPSFVPTSAMPVVLLCGEESNTVIKDRLDAILRGHNAPGDVVELIKDNLHVFPREGRRLFTLQRNAIKITDDFKALTEQIKAISPGLVILDPRSYWCPFDENDNSIASQFIFHMGELSSENHTSVLVTHHLNKSIDRAFDSGSVRGASSFVDNCRLVFGYSAMAKGGRKLDVLKSNYTATQNMEIFFSTKNGVPMETFKASPLAEVLVKVIADKGTVSKDSLLYNREGAGEVYLQELQVRLGERPSKEALVKAIEKSTADGQLEEHKVGRKLMLSAK